MATTETSPLPAALLARIDETMKHPEVVWVCQEDRLGCGVACLAMISGRSYADVRRDFSATLVEVGLADRSILWWLNKEQYWSRRWWMDGAGGRPAPTTGTALMLTHDAHWVVLHDGAVLDPARPTPLPQYDFRQAIEVAPAAAIAARAALEAECRALVADRERTLMLPRWIFDDTGQRFFVAIEPSGKADIDGGHSDAQDVAKARALFQRLVVIRPPDGTRYLMLTIEDVPPFVGRLNEDAIHTNNLAASAPRRTRA